MGECPNLFETMPPLGDFPKVRSSMVGPLSLSTVSILSYMYVRLVCYCYGQQRAGLRAISPYFQTLLFSFQLRGPRPRPKSPRLGRGRLKVKDFIQASLDFKYLVVHISVAHPTTTRTHSISIGIPRLEKCLALVVPTIFRRPAQSLLLPSWLAGYPVGMGLDLCPTGC